MKKEFGKAHWRNYERGIEKEWLLTNGIGGFASSSIIGANARRYHGILVAALKPPVERNLVISKIDERVIIQDKTYDLSSYQTPGFTQNGFYYLERFIQDPLPTYQYSMEDVTITKKITMIHGKNSTVLVYKIKGGEDRLTLRLAPLVNFRNYHFDSDRWHMNFKPQSMPNGIKVKPYDMDIDIKIYTSEGDFVPTPDCWFYNMDYFYERERGLKSVEDQFMPGYFEVSVSPYEEKTITVICTVEKDNIEPDGEKIIQEEESRIEGLIQKAGYKDALAKDLVIAADHFIVHRQSTQAKTIIAGYPWFTDWGRDTMISLPGLTLTTNRYEDAKEILYTFSKYVKDGLIPNVFPDVGQDSTYNSVDASLWYFEAVSKYLHYTNDLDFIKDQILEALEQIINGYTQGTHFHIKMEEDGLISAGDDGVQLTWMDAKIGSWVVTPRHGKAVEINALWYNALQVIGDIYQRLGRSNINLLALADKVKTSFTNCFWNEKKECLYDVISQQIKDDKVRPNQILAISLTYPIISGEMAQRVVIKVWKELYTAYGLRSLSRNDAEYVGIYLGDQYKRDNAYHKGTVWTWLLGHFITAFSRVYQNDPQMKSQARRFIEPFKDHLLDACIGSISEIFDGNQPLIPRGTYAQAWSVAEVLRAYVEDIGLENE